MGLEKIIENRIGRKTMGFGVDLQKSDERSIGEILNYVQPEDLLKYGLIPEFVGRLPVIATLTDLDEEAMIRILVEPKNALIKQYQKFFEFERVKLRFTETSLKAIAREAMKRKTGARGLRAILEEIMLDTMYELPSQNNIRECVINDDVVSRREKPIMVYEKQAS